VQLQVQTTPYIVNAPEISCRIVLANLIRNTFQHTIEGRITITLTRGKVTIINSSEEKPVDSSDLGFGLGLQLTRKLAARYGWLYRDRVADNSYQSRTLLLTAGCLQAK
jgi:signal transduction histidine kinase